MKYRLHDLDVEQQGVAIDALSFIVALPAVVWRTTGVAVPLRRMTYSDLSAPGIILNAIACWLSLMQ